MCKGSSDGGGTGYYCPPDAPGADGDMAFACMDWTFGSKGMQAAEASFSQRTGEDVYFGVGTFGTSKDIMRGIGACYRLQIGSEGGGVGKDLLLQSINTGSSSTSRSATVVRVSSTPAREAPHQAVTPCTLGLTQTTHGASNTVVQTPGCSATICRVTLRRAPR